MEKRTKIIIGVVSALGLGVGIALSIRKSRIRKKEREALLKQIKEQKELSAQQLEELEQQFKQSSKKEQDKLTQELMTDIGSVVVGKFAYPKGNSVNVRATPNVNNGIINNLIYEDYKSKVGLILAVVKSSEYGDKNKWYKVRLDEPFDGWTFDADVGYVREDAVTVKNM